MAHATSDPDEGQGAWIRDVLFRNIWSGPALAVLLAVPAAMGVLALDRAGLTGWLIARDLAPVATSDTAKDYAGVAVGVNTAFLTLYFSVTLIVLSLAASNLGVRLIDRWLDRRPVRWTIAALSFALVFAVCALLAIDGNAEIAETPLGLVGAVAALQILNTALLAGALHDLGRTMFVDGSVAALAGEGRDAAIEVVEGRSRDEAADAEAWTVALVAGGAGYVQGTHAAKLSRKLNEAGGRARFLVAPGQHVLEGDPLLLVSGGVRCDQAALADMVPLGPHRSDAEGLVFQIRLQVEIAARALSPAINDFYTALACADALAVTMDKHRASWVQPGAWPAYAADPRIEVPGQDFAALFRNPLSAFRQAACEYPSVAIRMIERYGAVARRAGGSAVEAGLGAFLLAEAERLARHASERASLDDDRHAIAAALERAKAQADPS